MLNVIMDWACRCLIGVFDGGNTLSISQIVERSGLARQTVHNHLKHMVEAGILSQETAKLGRGRPTILYRRSMKTVPAELVKGNNIVSLSFQRLKHACRFEKGGWCKELKEKCSSERCPLAIKTK